MICTWTVQYHLGLQILLFVEVMICIILYTTYLFCRTPSDILKLMGVVYYKWRPIVSRSVAVVAESIRCLGQETEQYEVCCP